MAGLEKQGESSHQVPFSALLICSLIMQVWYVPFLWGHTSDATEVFGRYSKSYAIVLALNIVLILIWLVLLWQRQRVEGWCRQLSPIWHYGLIVFFGFGMFSFYWASIEAVISQYLAVNGLAVSLLLIRSLPDRRLTFNWTWLVLGLAVLLLLPVLITALTERPFSPDEATWADYASSPFVADGLYVRTWLREPLVIEPGRGWSTWLYGWLLENVAFDIRVGRIFNFVGYVLAFVGIGAVSARLYGRAAGLISATFAAMSASFIVSFDYRPDHQLPLGLMLITLLVLQARYTDRRWWRRALHFSAGFLATLALQIHAAAAVFIAGFSLFYLAEYLYGSYKKRRLVSPESLLWYGAGTALGLFVFYLLNVAPIGGFAVYFEHLLRDRWGFELYRRIPFLRWSSLAELIIIVAGFAYLIWRRTYADRLLLAITGCIILSIMIFDSQGYRTTFSALYVIPVGTLFVDGFRKLDITRGRNLHSVLAAVCVLLMLMGRMSGRFIAWNAFSDWLASGQLPPFMYTELSPRIAPFVNEDDVIVGTHELIWTFPDRPDLYGYQGEQWAAVRLGLEDTVGVWEYVQPTLIIEVSNQRFDPGLLTYMDNEDFQTCQSLELMDLTITLYRRHCT